MGRTKCLSVLPDLASFDTSIFPKLKAVFKGRRFSYIILDCSKTTRHLLSFKQCTSKNALNSRKIVGLAV